MKKIAVLLLVGFCLQHISATEYNILAYGAKADTSFLSTLCIQDAIDACYSGGGGKVIIPAGSFKTGTIVLKSNVDLYLEQGAILYGSKKLSDYKPLKPAYISLRTQEATVQLIYAEKASNVSISGYGEIDGQGGGFKKLSWNDEGITRPHLVRFITCSGVTVKDITLKNSACWMQHYLACDDVRISGICVVNRNNFNNDGIDIDGCHNVTISDIITDSDDDGITLKSTSPRACENIVITNCVISSRCNAIKMGTESNGGFKNIAISNCVIKPSDKVAPPFFGLNGGISAISLEIVDGGTMQGIAISNITINGTESPLFIRLGNRARSYSKEVDITNTGVIKDVMIDHVIIRNTGSTGCSITGMPDSPVTGVRLSNISYEQAGGCDLSQVAELIPEKEKDYPEATMFGTLPAYGFFIRHATNIHMDNVELITMERDMRFAFQLEDVQSSEFNHVKIATGDGNESVFGMKSTSDIIISGALVKGNAGCLAELLTPDNKSILLLNNIVPAGMLLHCGKEGEGVVVY